ncbi:MAG: thioredoxin family protein [Anaerolineales bacterium]
MLKIKILGPGCANCKRLEQITREALEKTGVKAEFEKVTDYAEIMQFDILSTPGLVVNDKVVSSGRIPTAAEISSWLADAELATAE